MPRNTFKKQLSRQVRETFFTALATATDERAVQRGYESGFLFLLPENAFFTCPCKCDGYLDYDFFFRLLCEYKLDKPLDNPVERAKVLIQILYYLHRFEAEGLEQPSVLFAGDKNECFLLHANGLLPFLDEPLDWTIAPSDAPRENPKTVAKIAESCAQTLFVHAVNPKQFELGAVLAQAYDLAQKTVRHVRATPANISAMFDYFCQQVLKDPKALDPNDAVGCFLAAILNKANTYLHPKLPGILVYDASKHIHISPAGWESYFAHYDNHYTPSECAAFTAIYDRLLEDTKRRRNGEFYTPTPFVNLAHRLIGETLGADWRERYVVWDCAWGTGNLTRDFSFARLYSSTNEAAELHLGENYNPGAVKFLFDFLNDPIEDLFGKLPPSLIADLEANKPVLFFINPPYATANNLQHGTHKAGCSDTVVNKEMKGAGLGASAQQLFAQFLFRICQIRDLFRLTRCHLALFCNPLYLSGSQHRHLRTHLFNRFSYQSGILFNAGYFAGVSANWGIHFTIWTPGKTTQQNNFPHTMIEQREGSLIPIGTKHIYNLDEEITGSDWCKEPLGKQKTEDAPQLSNACKWKQTGLGKLMSGALGYYVNVSNNVYKSSETTFLLSSASSMGHGISVLPCNVLRVTAMFTARRLISDNWKQHLDEYCIPDTGHPDYAAFEADSILVALFEAKSNQSSLGNVDYKGKIWDIKNEWFWLTKAEAEAAADNAGCAVAWQAARTANERYVAANLPEWETRMSAEGHAVLALARKIACKSYAFRQKWDALRPELQLLRWDAGWHQLKPMVQAELPTEHAAFQKAFAALKSRLRPLVHTLGFLR